MVLGALPLHMPLGLRTRLLRPGGSCRGCERRARLQLLLPPMHACAYQSALRTAREHTRSQLSVSVSGASWPVRRCRCPLASLVVCRLG